MPKIKIIAPVKPQKSSIASFFAKPSGGTHNPGSKVNEPILVIEQGTPSTVTAMSTPHGSIPDDACTDDLTDNKIIAIGINPDLSPEIIRPKSSPLEDVCDVSKIDVSDLDNLVLESKEPLDSIPAPELVDVLEDVTHPTSDKQTAEDDGATAPAKRKRAASKPRQKKPRSKDPNSDKTVEIIVAAENCADPAEIDSTKDDVVKLRPKRVKKPSKDSAINICDEELTGSSSKKIVDELDSGLTQALYSEEEILKMKLHRDRMQSFVKELIALEDSADLNDRMLGVDDAVHNLLVLLDPRIERNEATDANTSSEQPPDVDAATDQAGEAVDKVTVSIRSIIAKCAQGSHFPLAELSTQVHDLLAGVKDALQQIKDADEETAKKIVNCMTMLDKLLVSRVVLGEELKIVASRESYGIRSKSSTLFEDDDELAVFRWEAIGASNYFSKSEMSCLREIKSVRSRYSRGIRAEHKVIEQIEKTPLDSAKIAVHEERAGKAAAEIEKSKERRKELERKKAEDAESRRKREEEKETKKREKEEARAKAAEEKKNVEAKPLSEKEIKAAEALKKQSNAMLSFFKTAPKTTSCAASSAPRSVQLPGLGPLLKLSECKDDADVVIVGESMPQPSSATNQFDFDAFERSLRAGMSLADISKLNRERNSSKARLRRMRRPLKSISVTVAVPSSEFGAEGYSELREVKIDNRMRLLQFVEDLRPAYFGTISKRSRVLNGRNPLAQDHELLNYDYDSEAEWEEGEGDGEDIALSDGEDEEDGNELEYDDFLLRDNDFGSDADSDGEMMAAMAMRSREGEETIGIRFIRSKHALPVSEQQIPLPPQSNSKQTPVRQSLRFELSPRDDATPRRLILMTNEDKDVVRLSSYYAIVHTKLLPHLGSPSGEKSSAGSSVSAEPEKKGWKSMDEANISLLTRFLHGRKEGIDKLVLNFFSEHPSLSETVSKSEVRRRIVEIAAKSRGEHGCGSARWICKDEFLLQANRDTPPLEEIVFTPPKKSKKAMSKESKESSKELFSLSRKRRARELDVDDCDGAQERTMDDDEPDSAKVDALTPVDDVTGTVDELDGSLHSRIDIFPAEVVVAADLGN